mgnify:CR=1 FL=1
MNRITESDLQAKIDRLNKITNSPANPYTNGKANVSCYHISHAYGGVCLHRMYNDSGACTTPLIGGHVSKRELAGLLDAYISGIESTKG